MSEGIVAKGSEKKEFERPEAGTYIGRCIQVIDLGTQEKEWQGKVSKKRQVMLVWELDECMSDGRPFVVNWKGTLSLNEKAALRKYLEAWRGKKFTEAELKGFDLKNVLDKPCLLTLTESEWQGNTYINVDGVASMMKGQTAPERVNELVYFPISDIGTGDWDKLYDWVKEKFIMKSDEYKSFEDDGRPFTEDEEENEEGEETPF